ncbi:uncharacterized protein LOC136038407 [Artemia franciscana]|uniref:PARP catalytic domain-containing protein n=1 Tax=Artemia franciscana TaxID=6661 RepID=A0AA88L922_ARTSF|nr:hypothetical protein QYM36_006184 [Artemia franciscana]
MNQEKIQQKRTFDPTNPLDIHFRIAEAEFRRFCTSRNVEEVTLNTNRDIETGFQAKQEEFMRMYGEEAPEAKAILAFHGTPTMTNIDNILKSNFDDRYIVKYDYGFGHYFSEFPDVALRYAGETNALILCLILPGKSHDFPEGSKPSSVADGYNSNRIEADKMGRGREIVIPNPAQIFPRYVVHLN